MFSTLLVRSLVIAQNAGSQGLSRQARVGSVQNVAAPSAEIAPAPANNASHSQADPIQPANHPPVENQPAKTNDAAQLLPKDAIQPVEDDARPAGSEAAEPAANSAVEPTHAKIQPVDDDADIALDPASLLPDLPPVPRAKASLIGGTVDRLDRVRDQITVRAFGGGKMLIVFDPRTKIFRGNDPVTASELHKGDHVYVDTILDGDLVFAKNIRLKTAFSTGDGQGTILSYRQNKSELLIRDALSPQPLRVRLTSQTVVKQGDRTVSAGELMPGTLVAVKFAARENGSDVAREVSILAVPGASFTFAGRVESLDLRLGLLVIASVTDHKTYEIHLDPSLIEVEDNLRPGVEVTAVTNFDGSNYVARSLSITPPGNQR